MKPGPVSQDRFAAAEPPPPALELVGLNELAVIDRWELERRSRQLAQPAYLGERTALCRMLGRYKLYIDTTDVGFGAHLLLDGYWESWLTVFMARRLKSGMRVVDVGANHGYYTLLMADMVGAEGRVAAIEPNPRIAALLRRSVSLNGFSDRTDVHEVAADADDGGALRFFLPPGEPKNARVLTDADAPESDQVISVTGARLATLLADWNRVDFLKIDVEGAEEAVIEGLFPILERDRPEVILEFNPARCAQPEALLGRLTELYGVVGWIDFDAEAHSGDAERYLGRAHTGDWLLHLAPRA